MQQEKEKKFFLQVLADYLNSRPTAVPDGLDWNVLEMIGQKQQLSGIVYRQCKRSIDQSDLSMEVKTKWMQEYLYNFLLYSKRLALLKQIDTEFQKEKIPYLIFKGTVVAGLYPVPAQRTMSDSDILVHEEDKPRACEALVRLGLEVDTSHPNEWCAIKNKMMIELHHRLIYEYNSVELGSLQVWGDRVWNYTIELKNKMQRKLDLTYHLVYVLLHLRKHFLGAGIGFRQFMDVTVLATQAGIDWQQAEFWFKELKLEKFSQVCFSLCQRWFDIKIPAVGMSSMKVSTMMLQKK